MQSLILLLTTLTVAAATRYVNVHGQLSCDNTYDYRDTLVELWERDKLDPDDKLAGPVKPSKEGVFNISGYEDEFGSVHFFLKIHHRCLLVKRDDCPSITDEYDLVDHGDPNVITQFKKSLVVNQTKMRPNCVI